MASLNLNNYPSGFESGVIMREIHRAETTTGQNFYVGNNATLINGERGASNGNKGTYLSPFATLDFAIGQCAAGRGDTIYIRPGYSETITTASAIDIDVDGVNIIGLGTGTSIPTIEFNNAVATVTVDADNVYVRNVKFNASITAVAVGVDVIAGATDAVFDGCIFDVDAAATDEFTLSVRFNAGCDRGAVVNCTFDQDLAAATAAISLTGASDRITIKNNRFFGDYGVANINGITTLSTNVDIGYNLILNGEGGGLNAQPGIELLTASTGIIYNNYVVCNLATKAASIVADTCLLFENYYNEDISSSATGGIIGTASADD